MNLISTTCRARSQRVAMLDSARMSQKFTRIATSTAGARARVDSRARGTNVTDRNHPLSMNSFFSSSVLHLTLAVVVQENIKN